MTYHDLIGEHVIVRNPNTGDEWRGRAIAYSDDPTILVEAGGVMTYHDLIGEHVIVRNPNTGDEWRGRAIVYSDDPTILVEAKSGFRVMLKASWAEINPFGATDS